MAAPKKEFKLRDKKRTKGSFTPVVGMPLTIKLDDLQKTVDFCLDFVFRAEEKVAV